MRPLEKYISRLVANNFIKYAGLKAEKSGGNRAESAKSLASAGRKKQIQSEATLDQVPGFKRGGRVFAPTSATKWRKPVWTPKAPRRGDKRSEESTATTDAADAPKG